jgi:hypothetical protein
MKHLGVQPCGLTLWDGVGDHIHITPSTSLHYLGVFFTPRLSWLLHVKTLATHAQSTVQGLRVLGNSVCGFSLLQWRRIFQAVICACPHLQGSGVVHGPTPSKGVLWVDEGEFEGREWE